MLIHSVTCARVLTIFLTGFNIRTATAYNKCSPTRGERDKGALRANPPLFGTSCPKGYPIQSPQGGKSRSANALTPQGFALGLRPHPPGTTCPGKQVSQRKGVFLSKALLCERVLCCLNHAFLLRLAAGVGLALGVLRKTAQKAFKRDFLNFVILISF